MLGMAFSAPGFYCVVAERGGRIVGSNCMDERAVIRGIGPVTVSLDGQNAGVGRLLMEAVIAHAQEGGAAGLRLVQAAFHNRSLSLYAKLGFDVREPLACLQGRTAQHEVAGCHVRAATPEDQPACDALARVVHGFERSLELAQARLADGRFRKSGGAGRADYGVCHDARVLGPRCCGDQCRYAGADCIGGDVRRTGDPGAVAECAADAMVSRKWPAGCAADDIDEQGALQRAGGGMVSIDLLLGGTTMTGKSFQFEAVIQAGDGGGAFVFFPFDMQESFGTRGKVLVEAIDRRCALPGKLPGRHRVIFLGVPAINLTEIGRGPGDITITLWRAD